MVAAERRPEHAFAGFEIRGDEDGSHGETVGYALGARYEVGTDTGVIVGKEAAGAAVACLDFVGDQHNAFAGGQLAELTHEVVVGHAYAGYTLDALDYDGAEVAGLKVAFDVSYVVETGEFDIGCAIERRYDRRVVGRRDGSRSSAVECFVECENLMFACME